MVPRSTRACDCVFVRILSLVITLTISITMNKHVMLSQQITAQYNEYASGRLRHNSGATLWTWNETNTRAPPSDYYYRVIIHAYILIDTVDRRCPVIGCIRVFNVHVRIFNQPSACVADIIILYSRLSRDNPFDRNCIRFTVFY